MKLEFSKKKSADIFGNFSSDFLLNILSGNSANLEEKYYNNDFRGKLIFYQEN